MPWNIPPRFKEKKRETKRETENDPAAFLSKSVSTTDTETSNKSGRLQAVNRPCSVPSVFARTHHCDGDSDFWTLKFC